jgi:hypothetical protein
MISGELESTVDAARRLELRAVSTGYQISQLMRDRGLRGLQLSPVLEKDFGLAAAWASETFSESEIDLRVHSRWVNCAAIERTVQGKVASLANLIPELLMEDFSMAIGSSDHSEPGWAEGTAKFLRRHQDGLILSPEVRLDPQGQVAEVSLCLSLGDYGSSEKESLTVLSVNSDGVSLERGESLQGYNPNDPEHQTIIGLMGQANRVLGFLWPSQSQDQRPLSYGDLRIFHSEPNLAHAPPTEVVIGRHSPRRWSSTHHFNFYKGQAQSRLMGLVTDQRGSWGRKIEIIKG